MRALNYSKTLREQARNRATIAEMIDIDSFILALDDIDNLESLLAGKDQTINEMSIELQQANERIDFLLLKGNER